MAESLKNKTIKGVVWSTIDRFSYQGVYYLVLLVIANILTPEDFGLVGMLTIFVMISQSLIDSGFSQALIRKQNRTDVDVNSVFYFNLAASLLLYLFLYASAPFVATFYEQPQLTVLMRVLCIVIITNSLSIVQRTLYTVSINFKTQAKSTFIGTIISGICGICFALTGFGVWSLLLQYIINSTLVGIVLWFYSSWRPRWVFSWTSIRELFSFGSKLMISGLIDTIYSNMYKLVIGKVFAAAQLGHYSQASHITQFPSSNISRSLDRVTYPVLCNLKDDNLRLATNYRRLLRMSVFLIFPIMCLMAALSVPLVEIVIGEKWHYAAILIIPLCFAWMWHPVHSINLNLLKVKGRSDLFLQLEIIKKVIGVIVLIISIPFGLTIMCYMQIFTSLIALAINTYYTGKLIHIGFFIQMRDLFPVLLLSVTMFLGVYLITRCIDNQFLQLIVGVSIGGLFYLSVAYLLKMDELTFMKDLLKNCKYSSLIRK